MASAASQQAVSIEETSASLSEISGQVRDNSNSASNVAEAVVHMTQMVKQNDEKTKLSTQYSHEARLAAERGTSVMISPSPCIHGVIASLQSLR